MSFEADYKAKLKTAEEAVQVIKSGDWVDYGFCVNTPIALDKALATRLVTLEDVKFRGGVLPFNPAIFQIENPGAHMCWNSWHY